MKIQLRVLNPADVNAFKALRLQRVIESPTAFGTSYEEEMAKPLDHFTHQLEADGSGGSFVLGAFAGAELVGIVGLRRHQRLKYRHKAELWGMYVAAEWRNRGIGLALLDAAVARSKNLAGLRQLNLAVTAANQAARSLYRSRGFETFGLEKEALYWEGVYYDLEYMQLSLIEHDTDPT